mmetsp:Transcript_19886/g.42113  ORF Transcript_19886/g.42113 Transcript_19886/m.42113 type:complete len:309 (-) Transcript_19886:20-946(-)
MELAVDFLEEVLPNLPPEQAPRGGENDERAQLVKDVDLAGVAPLVEKGLGLRNHLGDVRAHLGGPQGLGEELELLAPEPVVDVEDDALAEGRDVELVDLLLRDDFVGAAEEVQRRGGSNEERHALVAHWDGEDVAVLAVGLRHDAERALDELHEPAESRHDAAAQQRRQPLLPVLLRQGELGLPRKVLGADEDRRHQGRQEKIQPHGQVSRRHNLRRHHLSLRHPLVGRFRFPRTDLVSWAQTERLPMHSAPPRASRHHHTQGREGERERQAALSRRPTCRVSKRRLDSRLDSTRAMALAAARGLVLV